MIAAHFVRFSAVGALGIGVQLATLQVLHRVAGLHYLLAVALAVEAAILHNFLWHYWWTWSDRTHVRVSNAANKFAMLVRFNFTTGAVSIAGNVVFMRLLAGEGHMKLCFANIISITLCWFLNFLLSDRVVFVQKACLR